MTSNENSWVAIIYDDKVTKKIGKQRVDQLEKTRVANLNQNLGIKLVIAFFLHTPFQYCISLLASDMTDDDYLLIVQNKLSTAAPRLGADFLQGGHAPAPGTYSKKGYNLLVDFAWGQLGGGRARA